MNLKDVHITNKKLFVENGKGKKIGLFIVHR